jgi:GNAT superfamily N-acetyltransferase
MQNILSDFSAEPLVKKAIRENWENYHYCLGRSPSVELSIGRYLTWLITSMPDHFMNLVVCTELPSEGADELVASAFAHFQSLNIQKLTWLAEEGVPSLELKKHLLACDMTFEESLSREMAVDIACVPDALAIPTGLKIIPVEDGRTLEQWIHIASIGFGVPQQFEKVWYDFFAEAVCDLPFRSYLGLLHGEPVATSQLFLSAGVAGIYNVTCVPEARGQGIGAAITCAPLFHAREMGYQIAILQASELGARVYRRLGFQDFGKRIIYLWENEPAAIDK